MAALLRGIRQGWLAQTVMAYEHVLVGLRHGQTSFNIEDRLTTTTDIDLSELGCEQARLAGLTLEGAVFDTAACSPLRRAQATAELAVRHIDILKGPLRVDDRLVEVTAGPFEGLTYAELRHGEMAAAYASYCDEENPVFPEGAETIAAAAARAQTILDEAASRPGRHLIVSHGAFLRVLACLVAGQNPGGYRRLQLSNCGALVVRFHPTPPAQLAALNLPAGTVR